MAAIAVNGGHVSRALDFYNSTDKYFILGGTSPWSVETTPPTPSASTFKLNDVVGLKKVDNTHMVVEDVNGTIQYRDQNWRIVPVSLSLTIASPGVASGQTTVPLTSVTGLAVGMKLRIDDTYEGTVTGISGLTVTLNTAATTNIAAGRLAKGGALVEGAKYVYVDCYLNYNDFPIVTYRQLGLCTGVTAATGIQNDSILKSASYNVGGTDQYTSLGILEVLDNRPPATRDNSQREHLSLIIEF